MKIRIIFAIAIFSIFFSSIIPGTIQAQTRPNPKLRVEIPKLVARVNGVDIESKYIEFRLSQIARTVNRPLTVKEKTSIVKDLIEKEVVRELVNQQGKKENIKVDDELIEKELKSLQSAYSSEEEFKKALKARNISLDDIKKSMLIDFNARQLLNAQIKGKINISDEEVKKYYEENKSKFYRPEAYHTHHILAAYFPPEALKNQTIEELKKNKEYFEFFGRDIQSLLSKTKIAHSKRVFCLPENEKRQIIMTDLDKGLGMFLKNDNVTKGIQSLQQKNSNPKNDEDDTGN